MHLKIQFNLYFVKFDLLKPNFHGFNFQFFTVFHLILTLVSKLLVLTLIIMNLVIYILNLTNSNGLVLHFF